MSNISHRNILTDFDERRSIESNFIGTFESGYVALHPFYKRVFHEDFDFRRRLKETFHLIEPVTWSRVLSELNFKSESQLARAILMTDTRESGELNDYVSYKRLMFPVAEEDTIPEVLLHKYLKYLIGSGINKVTRGYSKHTIHEEDRQNIKLEFDEKNLFEVVDDLQRVFVVGTDHLNIVLLLPDHDCPYTLILGDKKLVDSFVSDFNIEGFWVDKNTRFDWWAD